MKRTTRRRITAGILVLALAAALPVWGDAGQRAAQGGEAGWGQRLESALSAVWGALQGVLKVALPVGIGDGGDDATSTTGEPTAPLTSCLGEDPCPDPGTELGPVPDPLS